MDGGGVALGVEVAVEGEVVGGDFPAEDEGGEFGVEFEDGGGGERVAVEAVAATFFAVFLGDLFVEEGEGVLESWG